jgi:cation:H+ antiporter
MLTGLTPFWLFGIFCLSAAVIGVFGSLMTRTADRLADATGLGEAIMGAVFLGGCTSLPGIVTSVTTAFEGFAEIAASNAIGGIAVQTVFLAIADIAYRKANLEHAAASLANMMQGAILVFLLALCILGIVGPGATILHVHPVSFLLVGGYFFGLRQISLARNKPMWRPTKTLETRMDDSRAESMNTREMTFFWTKFAGLAAIVGTAGFVVAESGIALSRDLGISQTIVGGLLTAVATSLPELVTSVASVRQGALTLAVGGVIGGNCFDVLFMAFADLAYRQGSLYHALSERQIFMIALTIVLTGILLLGLIRREKFGIANIGFESFLIILLYISMFAYLGSS